MPIDMITWTAIRVLLFLLRAVPEPLLPWLSRCIGGLILWLLPRRRAIALNNMEIALGESCSEQERGLILKRSISEVIQGSAELLRYIYLPKERLLSRIEFQGREHIDKALQQGRGVICCGGHFGNFALMLTSLAKAGYPVAVVVREPRNRRLQRLFDHIKEQVEVEFIPDKPKDRCLRRAIHCLRKNHVLFLQIDLNVISGGVMVEFFGRLVPTFAGPVVLALRTGAPVIPLFICRQDTFSYRIIAEPPLSLTVTGERERDLVENLTRLSRILEEYIRKEPAAWWWFHRRWRKAKPLT